MKLVTAKDVLLVEAGRYLAVGFSNDSMMGNDTVFECVFDQNGIGAAYISHNEATYNFQLLNASQEMIARSSADLEDGWMKCEIDLNLLSKEKVDEQERNLIPELQDDEWTLLFVRGLAIPETGEKVMHSLTPGELFPWSTGEKVRFCEKCPDKFKTVIKMQQQQI
uniref:DOMON domain-containing protein n=1 Tax=Acrobeloides nanus TaxID=290746 RepID=A0A914DBV8_9BILA